MTIIKQTGVQSSGHMKNLRGYINDDRKVILRDSLNMDGCTNPKRWAHHMWMTREAYGHNKAARRVRDKKTGELKEAKNTILFHQILGFNPDECDLCALGCISDPAPPTRQSSSRYGGVRSASSSSVRG